MNMNDVKRLLAHNQYVFRFAKWCFNLPKRAISYPKRKQKAQLKAEEIKQAHLSGARMILYCCVATHPNLGDLAQTMCTLNWLHENYPDASVVELSSPAFHFGKCEVMSVLKENVRPDDLIVFQSGYTMTGVHEYEPMREMILEAFPDNRIVLLPQTIFYKTKKLEAHAVNTYKDRSNLLLLARDRISFETAKRLFGTTQMDLFPDIVTTLIGTRQYDSERKGVLFCVRDDYERLYSKKDMAALMKAVGQYTHVDQTDTTVRVPDAEDREAVKTLIDETIEKYSKYRLIVTDRFHGTIFSLIAGTPVVVLKTTDHKVITGVEWFKPCMADYVVVADTLAEAEDLIPRMLEQSRSAVKGAYFKENYYDRLKSLIESDREA
jgi:exopolysaccharide biosynthesis predicted pyruvyltransferase EpsI